MTRSSEQPFIQIQNVSKHFGQFCALDTVSLDIELGQKLVICGPSGSGKSTLIRCINRLEIHEKGKIFIDGKIVDGSPAGQDVLRNNVGMVFQQFNLFPHLTILENLMLGPLRARQVPESALHRDLPRAGQAGVFSAARQIPQDGRDGHCSPQLTPPCGRFFAPQICSSR